jgi:hypothetical protein
VRHTVGKISTRATTLLHTLSQSKVCTQSYGAPKLQEFQLWEFWDSHLGVPGQNAIWMWALWRGTKYTIKEKVVAPPKSRPWWVLWVRICLWFVLAPKMFKLCTNQLVVWFVQVRVNSWCFSLFLVPILELQHASLNPPKVLWTREHAPTAYLSVVFTCCGQQLTQKLEITLEVSELKQIQQLTQHWK